MHNLVRNGRRGSRNSLIRKVGTGSKSQLFAAELPITFRTIFCKHSVNVVNEQVVGVKTGGAEPALHYIIVISNATYT